MSLRGPRTRPLLSVARRLHSDMAPSRQPTRSRLVWLLLLICLPLVLALIDCVRDLYCDTVMIRTVALRTEMSQLRTQTIRRASRLEALLENHVSTNSGGADLSWETLASEPWLAGQWSSLAAPQGNEKYLAVVNQLGNIVLHTDAAIVGQRVTSEWDDEKVADAGPDVVRIRTGPLALDSQMLDLNVPLFVNGQRVGRMHSGIDAVTFDRRVGQEQRQYLWKRSWVVALVLAANLGAVVGLVLLTRDFAHLRQQLTKTVQGQSRLLAQIGMGLAHELRNPLHALRINVHTLRRGFSRASLSEQQLGEIVQESNDEIDRMDALVRDFVQYTVPQPSEVTDCDLAEQIQATLSLVGEELRRKQIDLKTSLPNEPLHVPMPPDRLRQAALKLLTFAQRSAGPKGKIEVTIAPANGSAELIVADSGTALTASDQDRLFEPFQSTAHSDADLSLALIRRFVTEAGGNIIRIHQPGRGLFRMQLPLAKRTPQGV